MPSTEPTTRIAFAYSVWLNPRPPYFSGTLMPKAPRSASDRTTSGGILPSRSMPSESTSSRRKTRSSSVHARARSEMKSSGSG